MAHPFFRGCARAVPPYGPPVTTLALMLVVCPLLGAAVFASVVALAFTVAWLPRLWIDRRNRMLRAAMSDR